MEGLCLGLTVAKRQLMFGAYRAGRGQYVDFRAGRE